MADTYYAWSPFPKDGDRATINVGDKIAQSDIGVDDDEWAYLIETGVVSKTKHPDIPATMAPAEHYKALAAKAAEGDYSELQALEDAANTKVSQEQGKTEGK